jgi:hypothetical protein
LEQPSIVVPLKNIYSVVSTFIVAVTVDSLSTEMLGGAQFFTSTPSNSKMVTTRLPSMGRIRHTKSRQNLRWILSTLLQGAELL